MQINVISFFVEGAPKATPRIRRRKSGGVYTPVIANGWKSLIIYAAKKEYKGKPYTGGIKLTTVYYFKRPKKSKDIYHKTKPDYDNLDKAIMDALKIAGIYHDDCQVCARGDGYKFYICALGDKEGVNIKIEFLGEEKL